MGSLFFHNSMFWQIRGSFIRRTPPLRIPYIKHWTFLANKEVKAQLKRNWLLWHVEANRMMFFKWSCSPFSRVLILFSLGESSSLSNEVSCSMHCVSGNQELLSRWLTSPFLYGPGKIFLLLSISFMSNSSKLRNMQYFVQRMSQDLW